MYMFTATRQTRRYLHNCTRSESISHSRVCTRSYSRAYAQFESGAVSCNGAKHFASAPWHCCTELGIPITPASTSQRKHNIAAIPFDRRNQAGSLHSKRESGRRRVFCLTHRPTDVAQFSQSQNTVIRGRR